MTLNFPGPYELRINYTTTISGVTLTHQQRLNVRPGTPPSPGTDFSLISVLDNEDDGLALDTVVDEWIALLRPLYSASGNFIDAELWEYSPDTTLAAFRSAYPIALAGSAGGSLQASAQAMYMFRTQEGGTMRINLMESTTGVGSSKAYASLTANEAALVDKVLDTTGGNFFLGRDTSYPYSFTRLHPGNNEALFKKRFRS